MRTTFFLLSMGMTCAVYGQTATPRLTGKPQPVVQGANLRVYKPSDLAVSYFAVRSVVRDANRGAYRVTINVTVHNNGELPSNELTTFKAFFTLADHMIKPPTSRPPAANDHGTLEPWNYCAAEPKMPIVKGGSSWGGDLTFEVPYYDTHPNAKFYMILLADFYNNSKESNESNNYSTPLLITPPNH
ncbi:MAG TPA: hypothetical protein VHC48_01035 [Puia sp.]|nr:hypothetical protein [Puia sp.]